MVPDSEACPNFRVVHWPGCRDNPGMDGRAPWAPKRTEAEQRKMDAELHYNLETEFRKIGWGNSTYVHDEEQSLFRFTDGRFAFSREHADWALLRRRGRIEGW